LLPRALADGPRPSFAMRRWAACALGCGLPLLSAAATGTPATALPQHVDTSNLTNSDLLLATLYNEHRVLYAVLTTLAMAVFGLVIAIAMDSLLGQLGFRASKFERRE